MRPTTPQLRRGGSRGLALAGAALGVELLEGRVTVTRNTKRLT